MMINYFYYVVNSNFLRVIQYTMVANLSKYVALIIHNDTMLTAEHLFCEKMLW